MNLNVFTDNEELKEMYKTSKNHDSDSGFDMYVPREYIIPMNSHSNKIGMGIHCSMEAENYTGYLPYMVFPRSSMGSKTPLRLANSIGLIDKDYRGEIMLIVDNLSDENVVVKKGTRLAQIVAFNGKPFEFEFVDELNETSRGVGGLGSTGA